MNLKKWKEFDYSEGKELNAKLTCFCLCESNLQKSLQLAELIHKSNIQNKSRIFQLLFKTRKLTIYQKK